VPDIAYVPGGHITCDVLSCLPETVANTSLEDACRCGTPAWRSDGPAMQAMSKSIRVSDQKITTSEIKISYIKHKCISCPHHSIWLRIRMKTSNVSSSRPSATPIVSTLNTPPLYKKGTGNRVIIPPTT
jgi:hypothetical protein